MWKKVFEEIINEKKIYEEEVNEGASESEIAKLVEKVKTLFGREIPGEYLSTLKIVNGLEFNGFILYGIDESLLEKEPKQHINGLIDLNETWYENVEQKQYLFLGESNISWYVYNYSEKSFEELDNPSGREITKYNNIESMLEKFLSESIM